MLDGVASTVVSGPAIITVSTGPSMLSDGWVATGRAALEVNVEQAFEQVPSLFGRQVVHCLPALAQAQRPVLLHLQHCAIIQFKYVTTPK